MPNDSAAAGDAASLALWKHLFGAPLIQAAQTLIDGGGVSNVRVLQNGRVITGIAGNGQRVYVLRLLTHAEYSKNLWKDTL